MESDPLVERAEAAIRESERLQDEARAHSMACERSAERLADTFDALTRDNPHLHPQHRREEQALRTQT